ncbi:hypothetical protein pb186bvf_011563 [Paramecium bursaria]
MNKPIQISKSKKNKMLNLYINTESFCSVSLLAQKNILSVLLILLQDPTIISQPLYFVFALFG